MWSKASCSLSGLGLLDVDYNSSLLFDGNIEEARHYVKYSVLFDFNFG